MDALSERGIAVFALNPKQLDRFRDRFSSAGAKDDRRDALVLVQRRLAANGRLKNAAHHRAMAAIQRDKAGRAICHALRSRGHKHARAPGSVADRLLGVACRMIETGQTFDPERLSKAAP